MSLGIDQIIQDEKQVMMDKGVWGGLLGALAGYYLASQQKWGVGSTMVAIAGGHFAGHSVVKIVHDM